MDWWTFYLGGLFASYLMLGMTIVWGPTMYVIHIIILAFICLIWPIGWPLAMILGIIKAAKVKR